MSEELFIKVLCIIAVCIIIITCCYMFFTLQEYYVYIYDKDDNTVEHIGFSKEEWEIMVAKCPIVLEFSHYRVYFNKPKKCSGSIDSKISFCAKLRILQSFFPRQ